MSAQKARLIGDSLMNKMKNPAVTYPTLCKHCEINRMCSPEQTAKYPVLTHICCSLAACRYYICDQMQGAQEGSEIYVGMNIAEYIHSEKKVLTMLFLTEEGMKEYTENNELGLRALEGLSDIE